MARWRPILCSALLLVPLAGCGSGGPVLRTGIFPNLFRGEIVRTHAKPVGLRYFTNFDKHSVRLEVRPLDSVGPVRTRHLVLATVYDANGQPRSGRRIEWVLEGAGNIIEVDESGYFPARGYKVDNRYAVSFTDHKEHVQGRGNDDPGDDIAVRPGQSWCVISSAVEGDTYLSVYAPEIYNWDQNRVVVTHRWVDAEWAFPRSACGPAGAEVVLTTNVFRTSDRQPLANYQVRYRVMDGPPAVFLQSRTAEAVAVTDLRGSGVVSLVQTTPQVGTNRVAIEIIRPPLPTTPGGVGLVLARSEMTMEWQGGAAPVPSPGPPPPGPTPPPGAPVSTPPVPVSPQPAGLRVTATGPTTAAVGTPATIQVTIANTGGTAAENLLIKADLDEGLEHETGLRLVEAPLGQLAAGATRVVPIAVKPKKAGPAGMRVQVTADGGLRERAEHRLTVQDAKLTLALRAPTVRYVGKPVVWELDVANNGDVPLAEVTVRDRLPPEVVFAEASDGGRVYGNEVVWGVGTLAPAERRTLKLTGTARTLTMRTINQARVTALVPSSDGRSPPSPVQAEAEAAIALQGLPAFRLTVSDRADPVEVGGRTLYVITVANQGSLPGDKVQVVGVVPPELKVVRANGPTSYRMDGGRVIFTPLESLQPGRVETWEVEAEGVVAGDGRFRAELTSAALPSPVVKEESTAVIPKVEP